MKRILLLILICIPVITAAVSADDIWEPELPDINILTIPDLFLWGDKLDDAESFLNQYRFYGAEVTRSEDDLFGTILQYSDENRYERFTYSFMFGKDTQELWQIQTNTVYIDGDDPQGIWESILEYFDIYEMKRYFDKQMMDHAEGIFDGYLITADEKTIYYNGFDRANYSQFGGRVFFSLIDREYYEKLLAGL